jgi:hypothetical protein
MALAQQMSTASKQTPTVAGYVRRDEATGETYLRFPVPSPEVVNQALQMIGSLLQTMQQRK